MEPEDYTCAMEPKDYTCAMSNCAVCAQSRPTLGDPVDCSPPGSSVHGIFQAGVLKRGATAFTRGSFPAQGSNPGLLHYRQILYLLNHQGSICVSLYIEYYMWLTWNSAVSDRIGNVPALSSLLRAMIIPIIYCTLTTNKALCWEFTCSVSILTSGLLGRDYFFIFYKLIKGALRYWAIHPSYNANKWTSRLRILY